MEPSDLPWFYRRLADAYARALGMDPEKLHRMACGVEPWDNKLLAAVVDAFAPLPGPLTSTHTPNTIPDVNPAPSSNALRSKKQLSAGTLQTKFAQVLTKKGITFAEVVEDLKSKLRRTVPRSTVQSWAKPTSDPSYRAIPQDAADALKELYGVPLSAWPRIIPTP